MPFIIITFLYLSLLSLRCENFSFIRSSSSGQSSLSKYNSGHVTCLKFSTALQLDRNPGASCYSTSGPAGNGPLYLSDFPAFPPPLLSHWVHATLTFHFSNMPSCLTLGLCTHCALCQEEAAPRALSGCCLLTSAEASALTLHSITSALFSLLHLSLSEITLFIYLFVCYCWFPPL